MLKLFVKKSKGFTLVELLVVIAVIGILAGIVLVNMGPVRVRARDARRQSDIKAISTALALYYDGQSSPIYPLTANLVANLTTGTTIYIQRIPNDPKDNTPYSYISATGATFCVYAVMEDGNTDWNAVTMNGTDKAFYASNNGSGIDQIGTPALNTIGTNCDPTA